MLDPNDQLGGLLGGTWGAGLSGLTGHGTGTLNPDTDTDWLGWGLVGFGAYRAFRSKRVNAMTMVLMVLGMWRLGMISNILPQRSDGSINWIMILISAMLPPTAAALIGGAPGLIVSVLSRMLWKRRRRYFRRFRSYRPRFRRRFYRRRYYRRRR